MIFLRIFESPRKRLEYMKHNWVWTSIAKEGFLGKFCTFLSENNLSKDDFIEIKEKENKDFRFFVFDTSKEGVLNYEEDNNALA